MSYVIRVYRPSKGTSIHENEYVLDEDGNALEFSTARKAINYLADRNYTIADLRKIDFDLEERTKEGVKA